MLSRFITNCIGNLILNISNDFHFVKYDAFLFLPFPISMFIGTVAKYFTKNCSNFCKYHSRTKIYPYILVRQIFSHFFKILFHNPALQIQLFNFSYVILIWNYCIKSIVQEKLPFLWYHVIIYLEQLYSE